MLAADQSLGSTATATIPTTAPATISPPAGGGRRKVPIGRSKKPEKQPDLRESAQELEDRVNGHQLPRIAVVPATDDAPTLYETWVGMGGEGVVLKDPASFLSCGVMPGKSEPVLRNS
jgi:hypothetical protein